MQVLMEGYLPGPVAYIPGRGYAIFSDTVRGWRAACKLRDKLSRERPDNGDAPIKLEYAYTVERVRLEPVREDGFASHYIRGDGVEIPIMTMYGFVVRMYVKRREGEEE
jgi:hypothetical protein